MAKPTGYDVAYERPCSRGDCVIGIGWDVNKGDVIRFLVDLQYTDLLLSANYTQIARFDHNPSNPNGHDIYKEGIHIDVVQKDGPDIKFHPSHSHIPHDLGAVMRVCAEYLDDNASRLISIHKDGNSSPNLPSWSP